MQVGLSVKIALVAVALVFLLGNAAVFYEHHYNDWRHYQKEYLKLAADNATDPQTEAVISARAPRIEQLVVSQFGEKRFDRCVTCHAGYDDDNFTDVPQPFTTHPKIAGNHPFQSFGCTACHSGNGRGLSVEDGHGTIKHWTKPLLKGAYIEAGCAKCHTAPYLAEMPIIRKGAELFKTKACYACHTVEGVSNGKLGVELTTVGEKWPLEYLEESIVDPKANNFESIMPRMEVNEDELVALTVYLASLTGENLSDGPMSRHLKLKEWKAEEPEEVPVSVASGEAVFKGKACNACHTINGVGGKVGPDLSVYGRLRTKEWMIEHHRNPRELIGGSIMPNFTYSESELEALARYLESLRELTVDNSVIYGGEPEE